MIGIDQGEEDGVDRIEEGHGAFEVELENGGDWCEDGGHNQREWWSEGRGERRGEVECICHGEREAEMAVRLLSDTIDASEVAVKEDVNRYYLDLKLEGRRRSPSERGSIPRSLDLKLAYNKDEPKL